MQLLQPYHLRNQGNWFATNNGRSTEKWLRFFERLQRKIVVFVQIYSSPFLSPMYYLNPSCIFIFYFLSLPPIRKGSKEQNSKKPNAIYKSTETPRIRVGAYWSMLAEWGHYSLVQKNANKIAHL